MNKEDIINLVETIGKLSKENTNLYGILINIVKELSVIYPNHEIETLPAKVKEVVQRLTEVEEECRLREQWEACADNLIHYAKDFAAHLSDLGEIDHVDNKQIELVEDAIEEYNRLKSHDG